MERGHASRGRSSKSEGLKTTKTKRETGDPWRRARVLKRRHAPSLTKRRVAVQQDLVEQPQRQLSLLLCGLLLAARVLKDLLLKQYIVRNQGQSSAPPQSPSCPQSPSYPSCTKRAGHNDGTQKTDLNGTSTPSHGRMTPSKKTGDADIQTAELLLLTHVSELYERTWHRTPRELSELYEKIWHRSKRRSPCLRPLLLCRAGLKTLRTNSKLLYAGFQMDGL